MTNYSSLSLRLQDWMQLAYGPTPAPYTLEGWTCSRIYMHAAYSPGFMMLLLHYKIAQARCVTVKSGSNWLPYISGTHFSQGYQIASIQEKKHYYCRRSHGPM